MEQQPLYSVGPSTCYSVCPHFNLSPRSTARLNWLWVVLILGAMLIIPERPAWGDGINPWVDATSQPPSIATVASSESIGHENGTTDALSGGGGCFITASATEFSGIFVLFALCIQMALYGLRLLIRSTVCPDQACDQREMRIQSMRRTPGPLLQRKKSPYPG